LESEFFAKPMIALALLLIISLPKDTDEENDPIIQKAMAHQSTYQKIV
jgi:hypothetical protein